MNIFIAGIFGNIAVLTEEESWHCSRVLRKNGGDAVRLIDGHGNFFDGVLEEVHDKKCTARIVAGPFKQDNRDFYFHLAIAPTKQIDRIEWMIEKCVEIGVDEISLVTCKNSERVAVKTDRLRKVIESAVKQSLQASIPKLNEPGTFPVFVGAAAAENLLIAHCNEGEKKGLDNFEYRGKKTIILIGPEGDFTETEVKLATEHGFVPVTLGSNRLRTETAGLYACQAVSIISRMKRN